MSLDAQICAGPYSATYDTRNLGSPQDLGETQDGFILRWSFSKRLLTGDAYADTVIDAVYRGGNCFLTLVGISYENAMVVARTNWPYADFASQFDSCFGKMGFIGQFDVGSDVAGPIVLTAVDGTTAETLGPVTLTANRAIIKEDYANQIKLASRLRVVPLEFRLYPYNVGSSKFGWFVPT